MTNERSAPSTSRRRAASLVYAAGLTQGLPFVLAAPFVGISLLPDDSRASVASGVIAFYQVGYGIAALGAGPLQDAGVTLPAIFGFTAAVAVAMGALGLSLGRQPR